MSLGRLRWLTIILAIAFLICVQGIAMGFVMPSFGRPAGHAVSISAFSVGVIVYTLLVYRTIDRMQGRIVRQNEELAATNAVSRAVAGSLNIDRTMDRALENVMAITRASAGEIVIYGEDGAEPRRFVAGAQSGVEALREQASAGTLAGDGVQGAGSLKVIPLTGPDREIGAIRMLGDSDHSLGDGSESLLTGIGAQVAVAVMAGQLHEDVIRRQRTAQALYAISVEITSLENAQEVLWPIADRAREMLGADASEISLFDKSGEGFTLAAHSGRPQAFRSPHAAGSWFPQETGEPHPASPNGRGNGCPIADPTFSRYTAPLHAGPERIGELSVAFSGTRRLSEEEQNLLGGMAGLAAIAVQKSRLLEQERQVAVLEERERLAREMHDSLAQVLGYLHLKSETALRRLQANDIPKTEGELREMAMLAKEAYADVREAILGLREKVSSNRNFVDTLRQYLEKFSRQAGVAVKLEVDGDDSVSFSPEAEVQLMRVIQEALTNVRKHANSDRAKVAIVRHGGEAAIVVEDNGRGFDATILGKSDVITFGLRTMQERVERAGGRFIVDSIPSGGTRVQIFLPVNGGHDHERWPDQDTNDTGRRPAVVQKGTPRPPG